MAIIPINGQPVQYFNIDREFATGYYLKMYAFNTTDAVSIYTNSVGDTTLDKCIIDEMGYPTTDGNSRFIPHANQSYDLALYQNAFDADNDSTSNAEWIIPGILQFQSSGTTAFTLFSGTPTRTSGTTFTVTGDQRTTFAVGTRLQLTDASTLYAIVTGVSYSAVTTVTVSLDSGTLTASLSAVYTSIATADKKDLSASSISYLNTDQALYKIYELETLLNELPISLKLSGAVIDGSTDDSSNVQALFDAAGAKSYYLPVGTMVTSQPIRIPSGCTLQGNGYSSVIKSSGASVFRGSWLDNAEVAGIITIHSNTGDTVKNLRIDGNKATKTDSDAYGIHILESTDCTIENVWIENIASDGGSLSTGGDSIMVTEGLLGNPSKRIDLINVRSTGNLRNGIALQHCQNVTIKSPRSFDLSIGGVTIAPLVTKAVSYTEIESPQMDNCGYGIYVGGLGFSFVLNINGGNIVNCNKSGLALDEISGGNGPNVVNVTGTNLSNNNQDNEDQGDISLNYADNVNINGVQSHSSGGQGIKIIGGIGVSVTGSTFSSHRYNGVCLSADQMQDGETMSIIKISDNNLINNGQALVAGNRAGLCINDAANRKIDNLTVVGNTAPFDGVSQLNGLLTSLTASDLRKWTVTGNDWGIQPNTSSDLDVWAKVNTTIASGVINLDSPEIGKPILYMVSSESGITDTVTALLYGKVGDIVILRPAIGHTITVNDTGTLHLGNSGAARVITSQHDTLMLQCVSINPGGNNSWVELSYSDN